MINRSLPKKDTVKKWISDNDWTWLEHNIGGWHAGEQASHHRLCRKVVERLRCSVCTSVNRLHIKNTNQINIIANQIENMIGIQALINNDNLKLFSGLLRNDSQGMKTG